jgi:hypothetical protein
MQRCDIAYRRIREVQTLKGGKAGHWAKVSYLRTVEIKRF